ncbi:MAG: amidinotransferase [Planctomycetes bacterium]|nr:amidinotransferase [Planctomycetota bacterium]
MEVARYLSRADDLPPGFSRNSLPRRAAETTVLLVDPQYFCVDYIINPHMADARGRPNVVDRQRAREQWQALRKSYESLGLRVLVAPAVPGLPDMVFCANQTFPFVDSEGRPAVVPSKMASPQRAPEVEPLIRFLAAKGYPAAPMDFEPEDCLEGTGDLLWMPGRRLLLGGFGFRTAPGVLKRLARSLAVPVASFRLEDPDFYHLDTALVPLTESRALWFPGAFTTSGQALVRALFDQLLEAPEPEARRAFATNAHCPDGRTVLIEAEARATRALLEAEGFRVVPLETSEFRKSGGSVFCLKLALP